MAKFLKGLLQTFRAELLLNFIFVSNLFFVVVVHEETKIMASLYVEKKNIMTTKESQHHLK